MSGHTAVGHGLYTELRQSPARILYQVRVPNQSEATGCRFVRRDWLAKDFGCGGNSEPRNDAQPTDITLALAMANT